MIFDLLFLCGFAAAAVGLWWVYPPAALIAAGLAVCGLAGSGARNERRQTAIRRMKARVKNERLRILRQEGQGEDDE